MQRVCVYCGSANNLHPEYLDGARRLGEMLAAAGLELVYGAGRTGLMGAVADGALEAGGAVTGVVPQMFNTPQVTHDHLTRLEVVETIHLRKARMAEIAEAFIALPGGFGTFEELFEILTWAQIGLHHKPVGLLNLRGYFDPLVALVERAEEEGFIYGGQTRLFVAERDPVALLAALADFHPPQILARRPDRAV